MKCAFQSIGCNLVDDDFGLQKGSDIPVLTRENLGEHMSKHSNHHLDLIHTNFNKELDAMQTIIENIGIDEPCLLYSSPHMDYDHTPQKNNSLEADTAYYDNAVLRMDQTGLQFMKKVDILEQNEIQIVNGITAISMYNEELNTENRLLKEGIRQCDSLFLSLHTELARTHNRLLALEERLIYMETLAHT